MLSQVEACIRVHSLPEKITPDTYRGYILIPTLTCSPLSILKNGYLQIIDRFYQQLHSLLPSSSSTSRTLIIMTASKFIEHIDSVVTSSSDRSVSLEDILADAEQRQRSVSSSSSGSSDSAQTSDSSHSKSTASKIRRFTSFKGRSG